jgi:hypothetical protein
MHAVAVIALVMESSQKIVSGVIASRVCGLRAP